MEYDENDAIEFIVKKIEIEVEEDEILNIIDIIWDYYEDNGMLDISMENDFISKFLDKITLPKDIKMAIDVDPLDIL